MSNRLGRIWILAVFPCLWFLIAPGTARAIEFPIVNKMATARLANKTVSIPINGSLDLRSAGDAADISVDLAAGLQSVASGALEILGSAIDRHDDCGERLQVTHASLVARAPEALIDARLVYERFVCAGPIKTRILPKTSSRFTLAVVPVIENETLAVRLVLQADNSLEVIRNGLILPELKKIEREINGEIASHAEQFDFRARMAEFFSDAQGPAFHVVGDFTATQEETKRIMELIAAGR